MASVLNRITKQFIKSANTPDFPTSDWIIKPDLSAVSGFSPKYWVISGDTISLMNSATRDSLDASLLSAEKDSLSANLDKVLRAVVVALNDGSFIPNSSYTGKQLRTIIRSKL